MKRSINFPTIITADEVSKRARSDTFTSGGGGHSITLSAGFGRPERQAAPTAYPDIVNAHSFVSSDNLIDSSVNGPLVRYVLLYNDTGSELECTKGDLVWADLTKVTNVDRRSPYYSTFKTALKIKPSGPLSMKIAGVFTESVVIPANAAMSVAVAVADYCEYLNKTNTSLEEGKHYVMTNAPDVHELNTNSTKSTVADDSVLFVFTVIHGGQNRVTICIHH